MTKQIVDDITKWRFTISDTMRYETPSDWYDDGVVEVYSKIKPVDKIGLAVHEFIERILLHGYGIDQRTIDLYDKALGGSYNENMYNENPLYLKAHLFAEKVEHEVMDAFKNNWNEYDSRVMNTKINWKISEKAHQKSQSSIFFSRLLTNIRSFLARTLDW